MSDFEFASERRRNGDTHGAPSAPSKSWESPEAVGVQDPVAGVTWTRDTPSPLAISSPPPGLFISAGVEDGSSTAPSPPASSRHERVAADRYNDHHRTQVSRFDGLTAERGADASAVMEWQAAHGLKPDGMIGQRTLAAAKRSANAQSAKAADAAPAAPADPVPATPDGGDSEAAIPAPSSDGIAGVEGSAAGHEAADQDASEGDAGKVEEVLQTPAADLGTSPSADAQAAGSDQTPPAGGEAPNLEAGIAAIERFVSHALSSASSLFSASNGTAASPSHPPSPSAKDGGRTTAPAAPTAEVSGEHQEIGTQVKDAIGKQGDHARKPHAPAPGGKEAPPTDAWERFVWAVGMKESGNKAADADGVIGTELGNASGVDGSYGRYQTIADKAIDMLRQSKPLRDKYGFSDAEVSDLESKSHAVRGYWESVVMGKQKAGKGVGLDATDIQLAHEKPDAFVAKHAAEWEAATGLGKDMLTRMVGCIKFKALIDEYHSAHAAISDKKLRRKAADDFYATNRALVDSLGLKPSDLTAYMNKKVMAENLAGFTMAAAGGRHGHISQAINAGGGIDFGAAEVADVRQHVEATAKEYGVECPTGDHFWALCAKMHNYGKLSREDFASLENITSQHGAGDDYAKAVVNIYHSGE